MKNTNDQEDPVDRSGYPLQIALAYEVERGSRSHGWRVVYREHSWTHSDDQAQGFIDLALECDVLQIVLVIECKRVKDGDWIFLPEDGNAQPRRYARGYRIEEATARRPDCQWADCPIDPVSPQAAFCVMPAGARDPTVDKLAAELVSATEALAREELETYLMKRGGNPGRVYYPAIVTTARLSMCSFDPANIALASGTLPPGSPRERVSVVRYTKQLSTRPGVIPPGVRYGAEAEALASAKLRTAFIIAAPELDRFLREFEVAQRKR
jgi:hypothetical protein